MVDFQWIVWERSMSSLKNQSVAEISESRWKAYKRCDYFSYHKGDRGSPSNCAVFFKLLSWECLGRKLEVAAKLNWWSWSLERCSSSSFMFWAWCLARNFDFIYNFSQLMSCDYWQDCELCRLLRRSITISGLRLSIKRDARIIATRLLILFLVGFKVGRWLLFAMGSGKGNLRIYEDHTMGLLFM